MRIPWGGWLAATTWLAGTVAAAEQNAKIKFIETDFQNPDLGGDAIFTVPPEGFGSRKFRWTSDDTPVGEVALFIDGLQRDTVSLTPGDKHAKETIVPAPPANQGGPLAGRGLMAIELQQRPASALNSIRASADEHFITGSTAYDGKSGSVTILDLNQVATNFAGAVMYFKVTWGSQDGASFSRRFTVVSSDSPDNLKNLRKDATFSAGQDSPAFPEVTGTAAATATPKLPADASPSVQPSSGDEPSGPGSSGGSGSGGPSTTSSSSSKSSRLSTGAIAGIAVGAAVVGILVTGALIWFLIRRRRRGGSSSQGQQQQGAAAPYAGANNRTQELMAEKEAGAGADVSPHSPYSDDGNGNGNIGSAASAPTAAASMSGGVAGQQRQHERSFTPYSDAQQQRGSLAGDSQHSPVAAPGAGRATPTTAAAPTPTPYGHLVEEGMTEDDIRRLEAEERELDQAIEQAGRR
ncbi:hypothetical protein QBC33DRAFT_561629 [Phialemonium atrogriseum]|uniref:Mid2 domain-containing protein n=1 Tax=Phialemonium atrogriseum TaxID=1093897 RepID=A0AAJ0BWA7_9PEZI|nr:uncharacterized protein QBC33DRAFT_561629 [Phialemonium atrogriseum]KAK1764598.1 hypothetical protein QBC33DRAFT_561629 [Phialemonium atrogriseum]